METITNFNADISDPNENGEDCNSNGTLSHLLKSEMKYLFQDFLTVMPLEHNEVLQDHGSLHHHKPLDHRTSAINFLECLHRNNGIRDERNDLILSKDDESAYNNTDVIISVVGQKVDSLDDVIKKNDKEGQNMYFNVTKVRKSRVALFGSLRLFKDNENSIILNDSTTISIELYEIKKLKFSTTLHFLSKTDVTKDYNGWIVLRITELFKKWSRHPDKNHGVHFDVILEDNSGEKKFCKLSDIGVVGFEDADKKELQPFAVGFFKKFANINDHDPEKKSRSRRDLTQMILERSYRPPKVRKDLEKSGVCEVRKFEFSFTDFGWDDFVIAPSSFDLSFCAGDCPISRFYSGNLPMHSYLQILAHDLYPGKISIPCCAPTQFDSLNLLYFGHKTNILLEKLKQMTISKCECL